MSKRTAFWALTAAFVALIYWRCTPAFSSGSEASTNLTIEALRTPANRAMTATLSWTLIAVGLGLDGLSLLWIIRRLLTEHGPSGFPFLALFLYLSAGAMRAVFGLPTGWLILGLAALHLAVQIALPWSWYVLRRRTSA